MSLNIGDNFNYAGAKPLDARRVYTTKIALKAVNLSTVYEGMIVYVQSEDKYYRLKSGTWVEFSAGSGIGDWTANTAYTVDDIVINSSKLYICTTAHTSGASFDTTEQANWSEIGSGGAGITLWVISTNYNIGDIVYYANSLYRCNTAHTSSTFNADSAKWDLMFADLKTWDDSTYYSTGTIVINNNRIYTCITAHTSGLTFDSTEEANWQLLGGAGISAWTTTTSYGVGDIVYHNESIFKCNTAHTSATFDLETTNWDLMYADVKVWQANTYYVIGTVLIYDGELYRCKTAHDSSATFIKANFDKIYSDPIEMTAAEVIAMIANFNPSGDGLMLMPNWEANHGYVLMQCVYYAGDVYRCKTAHTSGATFDSTEEANWNKIVGGSGTSISNWITGTSYAVGDFVTYNNKIYKCTTANADASFTPAKWQGISIETEFLTWTSGTSYVVGDFVIYNNKIYKCTTANNDVSFTDAKWQEIGGGTSIADWATSTSYNVGDFVRNNNVLYVCNTAHTSTTFSSDKANWDAVFIEDFTGATSSANGKAGGVPKPLAGQEGFALFGDGTWKDPPLSRLYATSKVLWTGNVWNPPATITLTDNMNNYNYIIIYMINAVDMITCAGIYRPGIDLGATVYYKNTSGVEFIGYVDILSSTSLQLNDMLGLSSSGNHIGRVEGIKFEQGNGNPIQDWVASTAYVVGNLVVYNNLIYQCTTANNDSTFNSANWKVIGGGTSINDWVTAKSYAVGDFVKYNNVIYVCNTAHTSTTFTADKSKWDSIKVEDMVGATSSANGKSGGVPAPTTTDISKYLKGDGTWDVPVSGALNIINEVLWDNPSANPVALGDTLSFTHNINDYDYVVLFKVTGGCNSVITTPDVFDGNRTIMLTSLSTSGFQNYGISLLASSAGTSCTVSYLEGSGTLIRIVGWKLINPYDYSTSEKRIGTWVNGKALYQKTFTGYTIATGSGGTILNMYDISTLGIDKVISLDACAHQGNESYFGEWTELSTDYISYGVNSSNTYIRCKHSGFGGYDVRVTIRYTKI